MFDQKKRALTRSSVRSLPKWAISSWRDFRTEPLHTSGSTSWLSVQPSTSRCLYSTPSRMRSFGHSRRSCCCFHGLIFIWRCDGLVWRWTSGSTAAMCLSSRCNLTKSLTGKGGSPSRPAVSAVSSSRLSWASRLATMHWRTMGSGSWAQEHICRTDDSSTVMVSAVPLALWCTLDKASASVFVLPGLYVSVKSKDDSAANQRCPVASNLAVVRT